LGHEEAASYTVGNFVFILFIVAVLGAAFMWIGGLKGIARYLPEGVRARYSQLSTEDPMK